MNKDIQFTNIKVVLDRLLRHPLLLNLDLDAAILYTVDFINIIDVGKFYLDKEAVIEIKDYRAMLPCDLISVTAVKNNKTGKCMRSTTDVFNSQKSDRTTGTFKTLNRVIFTSFDKGEITVAYKAITVDDEGYPMVIDNTNFLKALELYIKLEMFTILFDSGKIAPLVLANTLLEYSWYVGKCISEAAMPSLSEMAAIKNMWTQPIETTIEEDNGFRNLGNRLYLYKH